MNLISLLIIISAVGSALVAGVFFAFSTFVMRGLGAVPPEQGISVMQSINVSVINSIFMAVFIGTTAISGILGIIAVVKWGQPGMLYVLCACGLYLIGSFIVTVALNVPLNDQLANVNASTDTAASVWKLYLLNWTLWNHLRTIASLLASIGFTFSLFRFFY